MQHVQEQEKEYTKNFIYLLIINIFCLTTFSMVHPVTPKLMETVGLPTFYFGLLYGCLNISTFVASPTFGSVCGLIGKKIPMIIGILGYAIGQIIFGFFPNRITVLIARIISGMFVSSYYVSTIFFISHISPPDKKLKRFAYLNASGSIGTTIGSLLGGYLGRNNYKVTFFAQITLAFISILCIILFFKDCSPRENKVKFTFRVFNVSDFKKVISTNKFAGLMLLSITLTFLGIQSYTSTISYYVEKILKLPTTINGLILGSTGFFTIITNLFLIPLLSKKLSSKKLYLISTLTSGLSITISIILNNPLLSIIFLLIFLISHTLIIPIMQSMILTESDENQAELLGLQNGFRAIGSFLGAVLSGIIFDIWFKLPFLICGTSLIISFLIFANPKKTKLQ